MSFSRREFLAAMAAGGMVVAGELWVPGQKTIFLPSRKIWTFEGALQNSIADYNEEFDYSWMREHSCPITTHAPNAIRRVIW